MFCYAYKSEPSLSSCHQRGFLQQQMGVGLETQNQILGKESLNWMSPSTPLATRKHTERRL